MLVNQSRHIEGQYFTTADYIKFSSDILDV